MKHARRVYAAFLAADEAALQELVSRACVLTVPGRSAVAGTYLGPAGMLELRRRLGATIGGFEDVCVGEHHAAVTDLWDGEHVILVLSFDEGELVVRSFLYVFDQYGFDERWRELSQS